MLISPAPLAATANALRSSQLDLLTYIDEICKRIDAAEPLIHALLPEQNRRQRLLAEAATLQKRFPDPTSRPPLYGILLGVKDMFRVDGFPTQAGSQLPAELFAGPEAACVTLLRNAGALILGKTISAEFAWIEPGPTRNPHNLDHSPGGSSSGSAAAVAAGYCPLALGTQTVGSTIRPAAFCGVAGYVASWGRVPLDGILPFSPSLDQLGLFTPTAGDLALPASIVCSGWRSATAPAELPLVGVPEGPYLDQASAE